MFAVSAEKALNNTVTVFEKGFVKVILRFVIVLRNCNNNVLNDFSVLEVENLYTVLKDGGQSVWVLYKLIAHCNQGFLGQGKSGVNTVNYLSHSFFILFKMVVAVVILGWT